MAVPRTGFAANVAALKQLDFDFHDCDTGYLTHGLHPYPAKYIPQIPRTLIQELSEPGNTVADIFCGSGTTLVEALLNGRNAIGIDANPLACLIAEAKTARIIDAERDSLLALASRAESLGKEIAGHHASTLFRSGPFVSRGDRPTGRTVDFWFEPFVVEELAEILSWCKALPTPQCCRVGLVAFSSIIVAVSKQDSDTRYVRRGKRIAPGDTMFRFARSLQTATRAVFDFTTRVDPALKCNVLHRNILASPEIQPFDLMVCSPPYPNAYSYHLYHMTRMLWLGMDQPRFKREEIGSHRKYSKKGVNGATPETFQEEMRTIFGWLAKHLKVGGFGCFVIGDSTIRGRRIDNTSLISIMAQKYGFIEIARVSRRLQATKKAFNPVIGKIKEEQVLILHRS